MLTLNLLISWLSANGIFDAILTYADSESHHLKPDEDAAETKKVNGSERRPKKSLGKSTMHLIWMSEFIIFTLEI